MTGAIQISLSAAPMLHSNGDTGIPAIFIFIVFLTSGGLGNTTFRIASANV